MDYTSHENTTVYSGTLVSLGAQDHWDLDPHSSTGIRLNTE